MAESKGQQRVDKMVKLLKKWQGIERQAITDTAEIMEQTENALVRQIMEIIRNDSVQHHRVQQFLIDSLTTTPVNLTSEELGDVWEAIEAHDEHEKEVIEIAKELRDECKFFVQRSLIDYLLVDEEKHDTILEQLGEFKKNLSRLG
jgi:rubrerythrin